MKVTREVVLDLLHNKQLLGGRMNYFEIYKLDKKTNWVYIT